MSEATFPDTHEVFNQSPAFENVNLFSSDLALRDAVGRNGAAWAVDALTSLGGELGSAYALEEGRLANRHLPVLKTHDPKGHRLDVVDYHPAYHACMKRSMAHGLHGASWEHLGARRERPTGVVVARAAGIFMTCQVESGHVCPITMTHAAVPALLFGGALAEKWLPKLVSRDYDGTFRPPGEKSAVTFGMGMTEKQGGTDVRANTTSAERLGGGGEYILTGHKWFMSAPMCDVFLMLALSETGLSCFLVPRILDDGTINPLRFQRLKDKLGNKSNASSEVEFHNVHGWLLGEEGRGVRTILEMTTFTRVDCALSSAGMMRMGLAQALHHVRHRTVFQKKLIDQPMMSRVVADLAVESEAATAFVMRLARAYDRTDAGGEGPEEEAAYRRLMTAAAKFWVCKRSVGAIYEAIECLGGNGYVEEGSMARLYREAPVNAIWEGSGNVMCLDVLRVLDKTPDLFGVVAAEFDTAASGSAVLKRRVDELKDRVANKAVNESNARNFVENLARVAAACELVRHGPQFMAEAFLSSRLADDYAETYGASNVDIEEKAILERAASAA